MSQPAPVLNTDLDKIVLIPLAKSTMAFLQVVSFDEECQALTITDNDYKALGDKMELDCVKDEDTKAYIINKFKDNNWSELTVLSDEAYEIIYSLLPSDMGTRQILVSLYTLLVDWHEESAEEILTELGVDYGNLDDQEQEKLACELLLDTDCVHVEQTEVNGEARFLYSGELC